MKSPRALKTLWGFENRADRERELFEDGRAFISRVLHIGACDGRRGSCFTNASATSLHVTLSSSLSRSLADVSIR